MIPRRAAIAAAEAAALTADLLQRATNAFRTFAATAATSLLDADARRRVTVRAYDRRPVEHRELFAWEGPWLERELPPAPARILIGGCGGGREAAVLLARGYEVWGFDPSLEAVRACRRDWPAMKFVGWFGYEQLACALDGSPASGDRLLPEGVRFDAVVLGWGSLSHVIEERDQEALFRVLPQLVPEGPILTSFWMDDLVPPGRAARLGARLGRALGGAPAPTLPRVYLGGRMGFVYSFDGARIEALAAVAHRRVAWQRHPYPHATFHPRAAVESMAADAKPRRAARRTAKRRAGVSE